MKKKVAAVFALAMLLGCTTAGAAANRDINMDPGASINRTREILERERVARQIAEDRARSNDKISADKNNVDTEDAEVATLTLTKIETGASRVLTQTEISAITQEYINRKVTVKELYEMVQKLNDLYASKGYATCGAILQPQTIEHGVLKVTLIEGQNGQVEILGNKNTKSKFIKKHLSLAAGEIPNVNTLNKEMLLFNASHDAQLRIMLKPGAEVGTTDYVLQVYEPQQHSFNVFVDNAGNYYTGEVRSGLFYTCKSLSGERDSLILGTMLSEGSKAVNANYSRYLGKKGAKLYFGYSTNAVEQVRDDADIYSKGHANAFSMGISKPVIMTEKLRTELSAELNHQNSQSDAVILDAGRFNTVDDTLDDITLSFAMTNYGSSSVIYQKHSLVVGNCKKDGQISEPESMVYYLYKANGLYQKLYEHGQTLTVRGDLQLGKKNQPTQRSFYAGGMNIVRGYKESILGGDGGLNLSLEYGAYINSQKTVQLYSFTEYARIYGESRLSNGQDRTLASVGVGLKANIGKNIFMNLSLARALKTDFNIDSLNDDNRYRANFFVSGQF